MGTLPKRNKLSVTGIMVLVVFLLWLSPAYSSGTITETFDNNQYNTQLWRLFAEFGQGATAQITSNRLEITVAGQGYAGLTGYGFTLIGDFDMKVDFTLIDWPASNGTQLGMGPFDLLDTIWITVGRGNAPMNTSGQEVYFSLFNGSYYDTSVTGAPFSGTLRLVRTGNKMEGFYLEGETWKSLGSATNVNLGGRVSVNMYVGPFGETYSGIPAKAAFSNIRINYTTLGPSFEPGNPGPGIMELLLLN